MRKTGHLEHAIPDLLPTSTTERSEGCRRQGGVGGRGGGGLRPRHRPQRAGGGARRRGERGGGGAGAGGGGGGGWGGDRRGRGGPGDARRDGRERAEGRDRAGPIRVERDGCSMRARRLTIAAPSCARRHRTRPTGGGGRGGGSGVGRLSSDGSRLKLTGTRSESSWDLRGQRTERASLEKKTEPRTSEIAKRDDDWAVGRRTRRDSTSRGEGGVRGRPRYAVLDAAGARTNAAICRPPLRALRSSYGQEVPCPSGSGVVERRIVRART